MTRLLSLTAALALASTTAGVASAATPLRGTFSTTISGQRNALLNGHWELRILPASRYAVVRNGVVVVRGAGPRTAARITFRDRSDAAACLAQPGEALYAWKLAGGRLTLTPVFESCPGRRVVLASHPLVRR